jgi:hypothetical protein
LGTPRSPWGRTCSKPGFRVVVVEGIPSEGSGPMADPREVCACRCETCLDSDCGGHVCAPHAAGRWLIVSRWMAHPYPTDFETKEAAEKFIEVTGLRHLVVEVQP